MKILCVPTGPLSVNTYIVFNESAETPSNSERIPCVVIDPANSHKVVEVLNQNNLHCTHILLTHGHFDHTMGVAELKSHENALVAIHEADAGALAGGKASLSYLGGALVKPCKVDIILHGGECFTAAGIEFSVLHTPGHTKGGVCYVIEKERVIFSGDTLLRLSVGRTDLDGGDNDALYNSLLLLTGRLKGDYRVFPGHMGETTLDFERKHNPYLRGGGNQDY